MANQQAKKDWSEFTSSRVIEKEVIDNAKLVQFGQLLSCHPFCRRMFSHISRRRVS